MMSRCLVLVVALVATCSARPGVTEYKCAIDTKCTGNSMQKIMMLGQTMCCPSEAQFNIDAGSCMCLELAAPAGMPSVPSMVDQSSQNVNATEQWRRIRQDYRNIGQEFVGGVRSWADNFGQGMRQTGRDLAGSLGGIFRGALRTSVGPVQRALNDFIAHAFRG